MRHYDNEVIVRKMVEAQGYTITDNNDLIIEKGRTLKMAVPSELVPYCPKCGQPMNVNLRSDSTFVEDKGWEEAQNRYNDFIRRHSNLKVLFLELGVGANTPIIIKYPFWNMTVANPKATYACINYGEALCPRDINKQSICLDADIATVLRDWK